MDRYELVLAALSPARCDPYTPVQVQKLLFLIDKNISHWIDGPHFDFQPYNYGPFDTAVYRVLEALAGKGDIDIVPSGYRYKCYRLTVDGQKKGEKTFRSLKKEIQHYIKAASEFVRSLTFDELITAIYKAYPEMKENSVFQG